MGLLAWISGEGVKPEPENKMSKEDKELLKEELLNDKALRKFHLQEPSDHW